MDLRLDSRNVTVTPRWNAEIEARIQNLQAGRDDTAHARVTLAEDRRHKTADDLADALLGRSPDTWYQVREPLY